MLLNVYFIKIHILTYCFCFNHYIFFLFCRDASRENILLHVKGHYKPDDSNSEMETDEASVSKGQAPFRCGHCHQVSNWKHVIQVLLTTCLSLLTDPCFALILHAHVLKVHEKEFLQQCICNTFLISVYSIAPLSLSFIYFLRYCTCMLFVFCKKSFFSCKFCFISFCMFFQFVFWHCHCYEILFLHFLVYCYMFESDSRCMCYFSQ